MLSIQRASAKPTPVIRLCRSNQIASLSDLPLTWLIDRETLSSPSSPGTRCNTLQHLRLTLQGGLRNDASLRHSTPATQHAWMRLYALSASKSAVEPSLRRSPHGLPHGLAMV
jgi:hypothetical protein